MFTPQQIEQISFSRQTFGGYDMQAVDEFLEPLTEDYVTLYKENALLKSKMRVLVGKLEEYRANEASMKQAIEDTQHTCDQMVQDAQVKCSQMLDQANVQAAEQIKSNDALIEAEDQRVEQAKQTAARKIAAIEDQLRACLDSLAQIRQAHDLPTVQPEASRDVAEEISDNLEALVGTALDTAPKAEPKHPTADTTSKFTNLQFGRNYDPTNR